MDSGTTNEETIRSALDAALQDHDPSVRAFAVRALAIRDDAQAVGYLEQALHDPSPEVRIMAIESVVPEKHGVDLLKDALSDADEAVRAVAAVRLNPELQRGHSE